MDRKKLYQILTLLCSTLAVIGCVFLSEISSVAKLDAVTTVTLGENVRKELKVDLYDIVPGSEKAYTINISYDYPEDLRLLLSFNASSNNGDLQKYLSVSCKSETNEYQKPLYEVFSESSSFDMGVGVKNVKISYFMGEDVGNEAQDAYADFSLLLLAKRL